VFVCQLSILYRAIAVHKILRPFSLCNTSWCFSWLRSDTLTQNVLDVVRHQLTVMRLSRDTKPLSYWLPARTRFIPLEGFISNLVDIINTPGITCHENPVGQRVIQSVLKIIETFANNGIYTFFGHSHGISWTNLICYLISPILFPLNTWSNDGCGGRDWADALT